MALTPEDGTGLANADTYISEADADTYFASHGAPSSWSGADSASKEQALRLATQYLDNTYRGLWKGTKGSQSQALSWPRTDVVDEEGYTVSETSVPAGVLNATAETALRSVQGTVLVPDLSGTKITREKVKAGPVEQDVTYQGGKASGVSSDPVEFTLVDQLLAGLLRGSRGSALAPTTSG